MRIAFPTDVEQALQMLTDASFLAYAVGGCVRDAVLGQVPQDWDVTTSAHPDEIRRVFAGFSIYSTGEKHGTLTVQVGQTLLEITTFRTESAYSDGRHPDQVSFASTLEEDLSRRDFTVNAMAAGLNGEIVDLFGGMMDLQHRILRCVGNPLKRFEEDGLRILRALRFAAVLQFTLEPETAQAVRSKKEMLTHISAERIWSELQKLLCGPDVSKILLEYPEIFTQIIPETESMIGLDQKTPYHSYNVYEHTVWAVSGIRPDPELRLTMLLHDIGKPSRFFVDPKGQGHFKGHPASSEEIAGKILKRLKLPTAAVRQILPLIRYHDSDILPEALPLWLSRLGESLFFDLLQVKRADEEAKNLAYSDRRPLYDQLEQLATELLSKKICLKREDLAVSSKDLEQIGFRGPMLGRILEELLFQVLTGKCQNCREDLLTLAGNLHLPEPLHISRTPVFTFRQANEEDAKGAGKLYLAVTKSIERQLDPPCKGWHTGEYPTPETAWNAWKQGELFVLLADEVVIGAAVLNQKQPDTYCKADWTWYGNVWAIHTFAIHPEFRGHGAAKRLLAECENFARKSGGTAIHLDTLAYNQPAIRLYEGASYRYAGTIDLEMNIPDAKWFRTYEKDLRR